MPNTDKIEKKNKSSKYLTIQVKPSNPITPQGNKITNMSPMPTMYSQPLFFQPQQPQVDISEVFDDEFTGNETINSIKNKEYKNLRALNRFNNVNGYYNNQNHLNNQNHFSNQINPRSYTEPCSNEDPFNSQESYEYRLNSRPFIPKSHNKQNSTNYYNDNAHETELNE